LSELKRPREQHILSGRKILLTASSAKLPGAFYLYEKRFAFALYLQGRLQTRMPDLSQLCPPTIVRMDFIQPIIAIAG
jgi:hypothetical protein